MPSPKPTAEPSATYSRLELILLGIVLLVACLARVMFFSDVAVEHFDEGVYASNLWFSAESFTYQVY